MPVHTARGPKTVGVLTAAYHAVRADEFTESLASIATQTVPPDEWVIVVDGPVGEDLEEVVRRFESTSQSPTIQVLRLTENVGNAIARQAGLELLTADFVAIQDADDISEPERLEATVNFLCDRGLDFGGTALAEFSTDPRQTTRIRRYPDSPVALAAELPRNNPVGHPSLVFSRAAGVAVGGYQHLPGNEDYDFVARLVSAGYRGASTNAPLVRFRMAPNVFKRRGGSEVVFAEVALSRRLASYGVLSGLRRWAALGARITYRVAPATARRHVYGKCVAQTRATSANHR